MRAFQHAAFFIAVGLVLVPIGCSSDNPFDQVQVEGTVTYDDGSMIPGEYVELEFLPQTPPKDPRTHPKQGRAAVKTSDGSFDTVTSHKYGDGVVTGKHKVLVFSFDDQRRPTGAVPPEYTEASTTPLEVDTAQMPWRLTIPKP
ncbi:MAG: hypothetical protein WD851_10815 [Pirellulales bacterium]